MQQVTKPTVQIKDCYLQDHYSGCQILSGVVLDYSDEHQGFPGALRNGHRVYTSAIVKAEGNTVETLQTIYQVQNWINL